MSLYFAERSEGPSVVIEQKVLEAFDNFRQRWPWQREAGGPLFARFAGQDTLIVDATATSRLDRRSRFAFVPHRSTEQSQIREKYREGLHFVGDWHSHSEDDRILLFYIDSMRDCLRYSQHDLIALVLIVFGRVSGLGGVWAGTVSRTACPSIASADVHRLLLLSVAMSGKTRP